MCSVSKSSSFSLLIIGNYYIDVTTLASVMISMTYSEP